MSATSNTELWEAYDREKNEDWEVGFLSSGQELGLHSMDNGKHSGGFNWECRRLMYALKRRFYHVEKGLLL